MEIFHKLRIFFFFAHVVSLHSFRRSSRAMDLSFAHPHHVLWIYLSISLHIDAIFFAFVSLVIDVDWGYSSRSVNDVYSKLENFFNNSHNRWYWQLSTLFFFYFLLHPEPRHETMFGLFLQLYFRFLCNSVLISCEPNLRKKWTNPDSNRNLMKFE